MKVLFLINPRSGARRDVDLAAVIRGRWSAEFDVRTAPPIAELDAAIDQAATDGFDVVFAVGGDGTVHEIAKRLIGRPIALGVLPTGSGNGLARHLGIPLNAAESLDACAAGAVVEIDTAAVNGVPFLAVMGIGLDAVIAERFASSSVRGFKTYVREGITAFRTYRGEEYEVTVDGVRSHRRTSVLTIANAAQYGNNARIAPLASLRDGLLEVVTIGQVPLLAAPLLAARLFTGSIHKSRYVRTEHARHVVIERPRPAAAHVDGEPVSLPARLEVIVRPRSLRVLVPPHGRPI